MSFFSQLNASTRYGLIALITGIIMSGCSPESSKTQTAGQQEQENFSFKLVTTWPKNYPILGTGVERFAQRVEAMSNGRLRIKVFGAGELVPALQTFEAVSSGSVQMGHGAAYYWKGRIPAAQFFTALPFGMTFSQRSAWIYYGGGLELWQDLYKPYNLVPFPAGNTGAQWGGWFNKPINRKKDLKGLLIRMPGLGGQVMAQAGAQQINLPGSELFVSMETGAIDAAEWVGPANDLAFGLHQVADYYYGPGWQEPAPSLELIINQEAWDSLPADLQAIVTVAIQSIDLDMYAEFSERNPRALETLKNEHNVDIRQLPDDVLTEFRKETDIAIAELIKDDAQAQKVYASWKDFLDSSNTYRRSSDQYLESFNQVYDQKQR